MATAIVDLPEPESPVSQTVRPFWPSRRSRSARPMLPACHVMFVLCVGVKRSLQLPSTGPNHGRARVARPAGSTGSTGSMGSIGSMG